MCSGAPRKKKLCVARALISFANVALLVASAKGTVVLSPGENNDLDRDVSGKADEAVLHRSWAAVPLEEAPTFNTVNRGNMLRRELDHVETTAGDQPPTASRHLGEEEALAGGKFGLLSDWHEAVLMPGHDGRSATLRGESCQTEAEQAKVHDILRKAKATPAGQKVVACVRTKDSGRFLPEWIAYHLAIGVNEITVYDDDSVDDTKQILQPFVDAGLVTYIYDKLESNKYQMRPLNAFLKMHIARRRGDSEAPRWLLFHDLDEYLFPTDTNATISEALNRRPDTCCVKVPRVQYGTGGYQQMPQGLLLEKFLTHANPYSFEDNRLPKAVINLDPAIPSMGHVKPYRAGMHDALGCECEEIPVTEIRINHYLGSADDYLEKTKRFWKNLYQKDSVLQKLKERDVNSETSDTITSWACATREILYRIVEGIDLDLGLG